MAKTRTTAALMLPFFLMAGSSQGAIIYSFNGVTDIGGGQFQWDYTAQLSDDQKVDDALGTNFGVIFDFLGLVSASASSLVGGGITLSTTIEAVSTQPVGTIRPDSAGINNVRTDISGAFNGVGNIDLFTVSVISTESGAVLNQNFQSAQLIKDNPGQPDNNTISSNTVIVPGPGAGTPPPPGQIPEPGTLLLLGGGLLAAALFRSQASSN